MGELILASIVVDGSEVVMSPRALPMLQGLAEPPRRLVELALVQIGIAQSHARPHTVGVILHRLFQMIPSAFRFCTVVLKISSIVVVGDPKPRSQRQRFLIGGLRLLVAAEIGIEIGQDAVGVVISRCQLDGAFIRYFGFDRVASNLLDQTFGDENLRKIRCKVRGRFHLSSRFHH